MQNNTSGGSAADVSNWAEGSRRNAAHLAAMVGVTQEQFEADPLAALPGLDEFEQSDWITLHTDLVSFSAMSLCGDEVPAGERSTTKSRLPVIAISLKPRGLMVTPIRSSPMT
ncbi:hypothetical protein [Streptomyces sp. NPDC005407]|uniref:hypothetical protein n=1 Tax=Streptomyces sp. NPDC005407 TaxID=3155340 RepID=UPI0033ABFE2A